MKNIMRTAFRLCALVALIVTLSVSVSVPTTKKVIYVDWKPVNWNNPADTTNPLVDMGFNVIMVAFWMYSGPADFAQVWASATADQRKSAIDYAHQRGAIIMVAAAGATESPYSYDAATYGRNAGNFAANNLFDGIDFDLENFGNGFLAPGLSSQATITWVTTANAAAKTTFKNARGVAPVISHAPQAPYFGKVGDTSSWAGATGGYTAIEKNSEVDFYCVQFYNQGSSCYIDYQGLFIDSSSCTVFPGTSVKQISSYGVPLNKIVVGKPLLPGDAGNGWVSALSLKLYAAQASTQLGWNAGYMFWMFHGDDILGTRTLIQTIFPPSGGSSTTGSIPSTTGRAGTTGRVTPATTGTTGRVTPATTGTTGRVTPATTGTTGRVTPATTGTTGRVTPATTGTTGRAIPVTTGTTTGRGTASSGFAVATVKSVECWGTSPNAIASMVVDISVPANQPSVPTWTLSVCSVGPVYCPTSDQCNVYNAGKLLRSYQNASGVWCNEFIPSASWASTINPGNSVSVQFQLNQKTSTACSNIASATTASIIPLVVN